MPFLPFFIGIEKIIQLLLSPTLCKILQNNSKMLKSIFHCSLKYSPVNNSLLLQFNTKPLATCLNRYLSDDSSKPRQPIDLDKLVHLTNSRKIMKYPYNIFIQQNRKVTQKEHPGKTQLVVLSCSQ